MLFLALALKLSEPQAVVARIAKPVAIQAQLVSADSFKPKKQPTSKPRPKPTVPKPKTPEPKTPKPSLKTAAQAAPSPSADPKPDIKVDAPAPLSPESKTQSDQRALSEEALASLESAIETDRSPQAGIVGSVSDTVAAIIQRAVVNRWTRPPSARNGMRAVLEIALVPTGDVVGVAVLSSSGNVAFDRSAINAVEKAGRFPEVRELDRTIFERDFRRFQLIFKPEDLRY